MQGQEFFPFITEQLRSHTVAGASVSALIGARFFEGELAAQMSPAYPVANFSYIGGGSLNAPTDRPFDLNMYVWGHSQVNYNEAHRVYGAIRDRIHYEVVRGTTLNLLAVEESTPIQNYNAVSRVYTVRGTYRLLIT